MKKRKNKIVIENVNNKLLCMWYEVCMFIVVFVYGLSVGQSDKNTYSNKHLKKQTQPALEIYTHKENRSTLNLLFVLHIVHNIPHFIVHIECVHVSE